MKKTISILSIFFILFICVAVYSQAEDLRLTVAHLNDTHAHVEPSQISVNIDGQKIYMSVGGFPAMAAKVKQLRKEKANLLLVHAGDVFQGTLYFKKYHGLADLDFLNLMKVDAMVLGNHEFDKGTKVLSDFIAKADFPVLSANMDASADTFLVNKTLPYIIKKFDDEAVAIIGLSIETIPNISRPGPNVKFDDPIKTAQQTIDKLTAKGINKIILLTHLGYSYDIKLAESVSGADVIIGGHSHTLLGDYKELGMLSGGAYPTVVKGNDGEDVLVVQAWSNNRAFGVLNLTFNEDGKIIDYSGNSIIMAINAPKRMLCKDDTGNKSQISDEEYKQIVEFSEYNSELELIDENEEANALLSKYSAPIDELYNEVVGIAKEDLLNVFTPLHKHHSGADLKGGSQIARFVCDGMLWKANALGMDVDFSLQNSGGIRTDIYKGDITVGRIQELLPFGNSLTVVQLTGEQIRQVLEEVLYEAIFQNDYGAFPYLSGLKYTAVVDSIAKITEMQIKDKDGKWVKTEDDKTYRFVSNNYVVGGNGGYKLLGSFAKNTYDTGFIDAETFMEYVTKLGELVPNNEERFRLIIK